MYYYGKRVATEQRRCTERDGVAARVRAGRVWSVDVAETVWRVSSSGSGRRGQEETRRVGSSSSVR